MATTGQRRIGSSSQAVAVAAFLVLAGLLLWWAKWGPYSIKVPTVASTHTLGDSIITGGADAPPTVSLSAGLDFARSYFLAIWPALVAGLVIAAAAQVLLPRDWLARVLGADTVASGARGAVAAMPTLMCSCCAAPVTIGLRRARVSVSAALAFWLGNPALNPVVLVLAAFVLPWQWVVLRGLGGVVVVAAAVALTRWWSLRHQAPTAPTAQDTSALTQVWSGPVGQTAPSPAGFVKALVGLAVRILPEYVVIVVALGSLRGMLFDVAPGAAPAAAGILILVVAGLMLPVPTGGEIAVVAALLAAGVTGVAAGALLITLPLVSLPSLVMVRTVFPAQALAITVGVVGGAGLLTALVAGAL